MQLNWVQSQLKPGILAFIFSVHCRLEMHQANPTLVFDISQLQSIFPHSLFLESQRALAFYRMKGIYKSSCFLSCLGARLSASYRDNSLC